MINAADIEYSLQAITADGRRLYLNEALKELGWEEQPEELAVRLTATLHNVQKGDKWLHQLLPLGGKLFLYADWGVGLQEIFRGTIFRNEYRTDPLGSFTVTAYDTLIYLARSTDDRWYPAGTAGKTIIEDIAAAWQIPLGTVDGPNVKLGANPFRSQRLSQMIMDVLQQSKKRGDGKYIIRSIEDRLHVLRPGQNTPIYYFVEENVSTIEDSQDIEELVTRVKIVGNAPDEGRAPVVAQMDGRTEFGILQELVYESQYDTPAAAKEAAQDILNEQGKPRLQRKFEAPDLPFLRRGDKIRVSAGTMDGYFIVGGISHNATQGTMTVEVDTDE